MENQRRSNILDKQFIFIIGSPRSGTTWLQTMLGAHPRVCTTVELTLFTYYTGPWIKIWKAEADNIAQGRWHAGLPFLWTETEFYEFLREFLFRVYAKVLQMKPQATHILDKHPGYAFNVEDIHTLLPHARFIHLIRDGRDVTLSMVAAHDQIGFGTGTIAESVETWKDYVVSARKAHQYAGQYLEVRYEDLLTSPEKVLSSIFDFCELPSDQQQVKEIVEMFQFQKMKVNKTTPVNGIKAPEGAFRKGTSGQWQYEFSATQRYLFDTIAGSLLLELGYAQQGWWATTKIERILLPILTKAIEQRCHFQIPPVLPRCVRYIQQNGKKAFVQKIYTRFLQQWKKHTFFFMKH